MKGSHLCCSRISLYQIIQLKSAVWRFQTPGMPQAQCLQSAMYGCWDTRRGPLPAASLWFFWSELLSQPRVGFPMFFCLLFAEKNIKGDMRLGIGEWPNPIESGQCHGEDCIISNAGAACPSASLNYRKPLEMLATSRGLSDPDTQSLILGIPVILI